MEIKLKLKVRDVEIELTKDEAIKLKELLSELTGKEIVKEKEYVPYPYYPYIRWWGTYQPITWENNPSSHSSTYKLSNDCQLSYTYT